MRLKHEQSLFPADWPSDGPLDLARHDLPHGSSTTEWWYLNSHLVAPGGRQFSVFAAFFRVVTKVHSDGRTEYSNALTWGLSDVERREYVPYSFVDEKAPRIGLDRIKAGRGARDERINRAVSEALEKDCVPLPDRKLPGGVRVSLESLDLDFGPGRLEKLGNGSYRLFVSADDGPRGPVAIELTFVAKKGPVRHGDNGLVRGAHGEDMFYYFIPRCEVAGRLSIDGEEVSLTGSGWYDHEFGRPPPARDRPGAGGADMVAWNWLSVQLDNGTDVSVYDLVRTDSKDSIGRFAVLIDSAGRRRAFSDFTLTPHEQWQSMRTFEHYPTHLVLDVPEARLSLDIRAAFGDQEILTVMSKPAFWEGRCDVRGTLAGEVVQGPAYLERSGFCDMDTLEAFFKRVGEAVRSSVRAVAPLDLDREHALRLVAAPGRERYLDGVDLPQLSRALIGPIREITDRGGKAWRSYAVLACCDAVGGDSRKFAQWLAFPELMHSGSLIVDDVQDKSMVRRGGPAAHLKFGEAIAVNAGTAAYFLGEQLLTRSLVSDAAKLKIYDFYFEALRAGHAGQAIDLDGLISFVPAALDRGELDVLERRVLAINRLKTGVPAATLARIGSVAGGGTAEQVEGLGNYFESLGLAFQIVDDVLNLRGFKGDLKQRGEDITHGKVTLPVVKALNFLDADARWSLWRIISSCPSDPKVVADALARIEVSGALDACEAQASELVESAWGRLAPLLEESQSKVMLRAFGWYVLERHY